MSTDVVYIDTDPLGVATVSTAPAQLVVSPPVDVVEVDVDPMGSTRLDSSTVVVVGDTASGPRGPAGPAGPEGDAFRYTHEQAVPSDLWTIPHNLNGYPAGLSVEDSTGRMVEGAEVHYPDPNTVTLSFIGAFSGRAYLS